MAAKKEKAPVVRVVTMEVAIPYQHLLDVMTTACEGGIVYWFNDEELVSQPGESKRDKDLNWLEVTFTSKHKKKPEVITVTPDKLADAYAKVVSGKVKLGRHIVAMIQSLPTENCDIDADGADCLFQIAAFGEVVYG